MMYWKLCQFLQKAFSTKITVIWPRVCLSGLSFLDGHSCCPVFGWLYNEKCAYHFPHLVTNAIRFLRLTFSQLMTASLFLCSSWSDNLLSLLEDSVLADAGVIDCDWMIFNSEKAMYQWQDLSFPLRSKLLPEWATNPEHDPKDRCQWNNIHRRYSF